MLRRVVCGLCALVVLAGCGVESSRPAKLKTDGPAPNRELVGSARTPEGVILRVKKAERLSPTEVKLTVQLFNPGAVPLPQTVGPDNFYVTPLGSAAQARPAADPARSTLKKVSIAPRESTEGEVLLTLPGSGPVEVLYGDTPEVSVSVMRLEAGS
jgi:hypothetical protein